MLNEAEEQALENQVKANMPFTRLVNRVGEEEAVKSRDIEFLQSTEIEIAKTEARITEKRKKFQEFGRRKRT